MIETLEISAPFYYIEYGFAPLAAIALWGNFKLKPKEAILKYKKALSIGYTSLIIEIYETTGINFAFNKEYVAELE